MPTYCHLKTKPTFQLYNFIIKEPNYKDQFTVRDHHRLHAQGHEREELFWKNKMSAAKIFPPTFQIMVYIYLI